jgi:ABC-type sugar transport system ATPase subunit
MLEEPLLKLESISKSFGAVQALLDVDFELYPSEVLGLIGDNGAGKSTLIKVISGAHLADSGRIFFKGRQVSIRRPEDARSLGIETVYQDLSLFENSDIAQNLFAGREVTRRFCGMATLNKRRMHRESQKILDSVKIRIDSTHALVKGLSGGQRQSVAIGRAIAFSKEILILDEPTAALGVPEQMKVLQMVRDIRDEGYSIIIITHNLEHVFAVADRLHVLRQGKTAGKLKLSETSPEEVVKLITGADLVEKEHRD